MHFKKINNILGWAVFAIALFTYLATAEATASLWDCGEFISTAYRLEVGHSPGAPLFMMIGRVFTLFASSKEMVAFTVNAMSALMSALTILFLFWTITHFGKKLIEKESNDSAGLTNNQLIAIVGAGLVGALAYTFSDTFWFSAVEGEVYATSSFFTAFVFWAILKWEHVANEKHADRWLILIFYMMGLSIGVHLLNLLTIPAILMVYYFKRFDATLKGSIIAFMISIVILAFVQFGVIQYIPIFAAKFELFFVNSLGMPFNSGALVFLCLFAAFLAWLLIYAKKKGKYILHLATLCLVFIMIGYSSYVAIIIRSKADVPIDMGNPDNVMSLIPYLQREQYGAQPVFSGPYYNTPPVGVNDDGPVYAAVTEDGRSYYKVVDTKKSYKYAETKLFPRIWSADPNHVNFYKNYLGLGDNDDPTGLDNQKFFWGYQMNWMYWRYFMWNYVGRQNDYQGQGEAKNGNWLSGIKVIDKMMGRGDVDLLSDAYSKNPARNQLYFLPFILGILGLVYQYKRDKEDTAIVVLLFFFTGAAIVMYLNNTPYQPRERDYAYAGSTYAFAIWIGLGVMFVSDLFKKFLKTGVGAPALATVLCLAAVPVLMASQEWDDHDRSQKTIAKDHAYNMLSSCDSNAILLTNGDNDTYPLWYLQEVEGFRTDVRIINLNLMGTDWQNEQLTFKINNADAVPMIWNKSEFMGGDLNYITYAETSNIPKDKFFELEEVIQFFSSGKNQLTTRGGGKANYLPTKNMKITVNKDAVLKSGIVKASNADFIPEEMVFVYNKDNATRSDMSFLNIVAGQAKTGWTRPIYVAQGTNKLGLDRYFKSEGILEKLVPMDQPSKVQGLLGSSDLDKNIELVTKTFTFGKANTDKIYYDEKNRLIFLNYRQRIGHLAIELTANDRKEDAIKVLDHFLSSVSEHSLPYDFFLYDRGMLMIIDAYYAAGANEKAQKYGEKLVNNVRKEAKYFNSLKPSEQDGMNAFILQNSLSGISAVIQSAQRNGDDASAQKWEQTLKAIAPPGFKI